MADSITYEQPLNERIRTFLRLEFLFTGLDTALKGDSEQNNRDAIQALSNILSVFDRTDLKQEIIKELDRLISDLSALENSPGVDKYALNSLLDELDQIVDSLHLIKTAIGQALRENDFLYSIRQRSSIPGGTCDFDLPAYHFWLQHVSDEQRKQHLLEWSKQFSAVQSAVNIVLRLIRSSTGFTPATASAGFYQHSLDSSQTTQIIRVKIAKNAAYFPEISGGKHRFTVRFMTFELGQRPQQVTDDIDFSLSCCSM
ncbi:MAG: cell division protein ZapD [Gammaproteobacteria bacterium]|nr:MAG: cell division protein ZapD [Gammaproteobacteria bacterium]